MKTLVWFRRDLRVNDNLALAHAALDSSDGVIGFYAITPDQWLEHDDAPVKIKFWMESLRELSDALGKLNIPLLIQTGKTFSDSIDLVMAAVKKYKCEAVYWNREYEVNEARRDEAVIDHCRTQSIKVRQFHDRIIVPPREIETKQGNFYSVFTPYRRVWDKLIDGPPNEFTTVVKRPRKQADLNIKSSKVPEKILGYDLSVVSLDRWTPGEKEAQKRLKVFAEIIGDYQDARDMPALRGTSKLSPYLVAGSISPRQCLQAAHEACGGKALNEGATTWVSELTWRDFYTHVMVGFPRVSMHRPFKLKTDDLAWREDQNDFEAWCAGQTGYPIVDAGMRQLNASGWMHNRLRMVTAMFLTKNLLIDWRKGEQYFMSKLIDGDLAANNGGWQWSASTGTDAVPYFRIFNPFSQSKRFDKDGEFIKQMCPELKKVPSNALHDPKKLAAAIEARNVEYADYVVDYKASRERCLAAFKEN